LRVQFRHVDEDARDEIVKYVLKRQLEVAWG